MFAPPITRLNVLGSHSPPPAADPRPDDDFSPLSAPTYSSMSPSRERSHAMEEIESVGEDLPPLDVEEGPASIITRIGPSSSPHYTALASDELSMALLNKLQQIQSVMITGDESSPLRQRSLKFDRSPTPPAPQVENEVGSEVMSCTSDVAFQDDHTLMQTSTMLNAIREVDRSSRPAPPRQQLLPMEQMVSSLMWGPLGELGEVARQQANSSHSNSKQEVKPLRTAQTIFNGVDNTVATLRHTRQMHDDSHIPIGTKLGALIVVAPPASAVAAAQQKLLQNSSLSQGEITRAETQNVVRSHNFPINGQSNSLNLTSSILAGHEVRSLLDDEARRHETVMLQIQQERKEEKQKTLHHLKALLSKVQQMERDHAEEISQLHAQLEEEQKANRERNRLEKLHVNICAASNVDNEALTAALAETKKLAGEAEELRGVLSDAEEVLQEEKEKWSIQLIEARREIDRADARAAAAEARLSAASAGGPFTAADNPQPEFRNGSFDSITSASAAAFAGTTRSTLSASAQAVLARVQSERITEQKPNSLSIPEKQSSAGVIRGAFESPEKDRLRFIPTRDDGDRLCSPMDEQTKPSALRSTSKYQETMAQTSDLNTGFQEDKAADAESVREALMKEMEAMRVDYQAKIEALKADAEEASERDKSVLESYKQRSEWMRTSELEKLRTELTALKASNESLQKDLVHQKELLEQERAKRKAAFQLMTKEADDTMAMLTPRHASTAPQPTLNITTPPTLSKTVSAAALAVVNSTLSRMNSTHSNKVLTNVGTDSDKGPPALAAPTASVLADTSDLRAKINELSTALSKSQKALSDAKSDCRQEKENATKWQVQLADAQRQLTIAKADLVEAEALAETKSTEALKKERARVAVATNLLQKKIDDLNKEVVHLRQQNSNLLVMLAEDRGPEALPTVAFVKAKPPPSTTSATFSATILRDDDVDAVEGNDEGHVTRHGMAAPAGSFAGPTLSSLSHRLSVASMSSSSSQVNARSRSLSLKRANAKSLSAQDSTTSAALESIVANNRSHTKNATSWENNYNDFLPRMGTERLPRK